MLVLSRKENQSIMIGHDITITILEIRGDQVRVGIQAPRNIDVHREEVFAALQKANEESASPSRSDLEALGKIKTTNKQDPQANKDT